MRKDKPKNTYRGLKIFTVAVRTVGIILLLLTLSSAATLGLALWTTRGSIQDAEFLGYRALIMESEKMEPDISRNALVFINMKADFSSVERFDIIAYAPETGDPPVLSRVGVVGEVLEVCQINQDINQAQFVDADKFLGAVPGDFGLFPRPVGIWNWAAPIVGDVRVPAEEGTQANSGVSWKGVAKWGGLFLLPALEFAILWIVLEAALTSRKKRSQREKEPEDVYSASPPPPLPPGQTPTLKQAPDGQPVAVFPPAQPILGMPDDRPAAAKPVFAPPAGAAPVTARPTAVTPPPMEYPAPRPAEYAPAHQPSAPPARPAQATFPTLPRPGSITAIPAAPPPIPPMPETPAGHVATDDEFAEMLRKFEQLIMNN